MMTIVVLGQIRIPIGRAASDRSEPVFGLSRRRSAGELAGRRVVDKRAARKRCDIHVSTIDAKQRFDLLLVDHASRTGTQQRVVHVRTQLENHIIGETHPTHDAYDIVRTEIRHFLVGLYSEIVQERWGR